MGNCLRSQEKAVQITKTDGKVLKLRSPSKVNLIPLPTQSSKVEKKKLRLSEPEVAEERERKHTRIRVKLVASKQDLQEMLQDGIALMDGAVPDSHNKKCTTKELDEHRYGGKTWKPALRSILEAD